MPPVPTDLLEYVRFSFHYIDETAHPPSGSLPLVSMVGNTNFQRASRRLFPSKLKQGPDQGGFPLSVNPCMAAPS